MIEKFGKPYVPIMKYKKGFYLDNDSYLSDGEKVSEIYKRQPKRTKCIICGEAISDHTESFNHHGIKYFICGKCGHVNGEYLETDDFSRDIYQGTDYGAEYREESDKRYVDRVKDIYIPKAEFLLESLEKNGVEGFDRFAYLDIGAGSGYFVQALRKLGVDAFGVEVSRDQVDYGNHVSGENILEQCDQENIVERIKKSKADVISFVGVLEHIVNIHDVLRAVNTNQSIKYVFFSVPMMSYSVILEAFDESFYNRQLCGVGAHTHLFSESSIDYMCKQYEWIPVAKWKFGTDIADLYRMLTVNLEKKRERVLVEMLSNSFIGIMDDLQLIVDRDGLPSEVHIVVEKLVKDN